jgi:hypothetical protein
MPPVDQTVAATARQVQSALLVMNKIDHEGCGVHVRWVPAGRGPRYRDRVRWT